MSIKNWIWGLLIWMCICEISHRSTSWPWYLFIPVLSVLFPFLVASRREGPNSKVQVWDNCLNQHPLLFPSPLMVVFLSSSYEVGGQAIAVRATSMFLNKSAHVGEKRTNPVPRKLSPIHLVLFTLKQKRVKSLQVLIVWRIKSLFNSILVAYFKPRIIRSSQNGC